MSPPTGDSSPSSGTPGSGEGLGDIRSELRRLGYLDHRVERYLLQDALRPEKPWQTLVYLAVKVGLLIGPPAALVTALGLAAANGLFAANAFDLLPLFAHLLPPMILIPGLAFLIPAALLALMLRLTHVRRIEALSLGFSMVAAVAAMATVSQQLGWTDGDTLRSHFVAAALILPLFAYLVFKVVHGGLLTLAIRVSRLTPEQPSSYGRWVIVALLVSTFLFLVPAVLEVERDGVASPTSLPVADGRAVVVIGVDGVPAQELDYLWTGGELPRLAAAAESGVVASYERSDEPPIAFWTTVSTGLPSAEHGLDALDTFRPLGMSSPLRRSAGLRAYWQLGARLGWVSYRPILASNRRAFTFWELAGRGGAQALVAGWWGTFPAEPLSGTVLAHGAASLLRDGAERAVHPPDLAPAMASAARETRFPDELEAALRRVLPEDEVEVLLQDVLLPDVFYLQSFESLWTDETRSGALYLPALDILAANGDSGASAPGAPVPGALVRADLVRRQLIAVDGLIGRLLDRGVSVVLVVDPGRVPSTASQVGTQGPAALGRAFVLGAEVRSCPLSDEEGIVEPAQIGSAVLRLLGLPQSREVPKPMGCGWRKPSMTVESYGRRTAAGADGAESAEYLENLKSLGYL